MTGVAADLELRYVLRDGEQVPKLRCPNCGKWGTLDDDQLHGRVSILHDSCGFHETLDFSRHPLVLQNDEYEYLAERTKRR